MTFQKPVGGANLYIWCGYIQYTICNHIQRQVSVSTNSDPINMIHTNQQSTKEGLNKYLEVYFRSGDEII